MTSEEILEKSFLQREMVEVLLNGSEEELKQYFTKSEKTNNDLYSDLQFNINLAFKVSANSGLFNKVKYLLTSPDLEIHADIHFDDDCAMESACCWGYGYLVEYFLHSEDLKEHLKLPQDMRFAFESILTLIDEVKHENNHCSDSIIDSQNNRIEDYLEFLTYLIYDCNIKPTEEIINLLERKTDKEFHEPAIKKMKINALVSSLESELDEKDNFKVKKPKL
jgi:hypothetical protein